MMSVIKKQFTWKFGYPRFQKKLKLQFEKEGELEKPGEEFAWDETESCSSLVVAAASESVCWDFGDPSANIDKKVQSPVPLEVEAPESIQELEAECEQIYCNLVELAQNPIYENQRPENGESDHLYENTNSKEPLYENCSGSVSEEDKEHIYEPVSCQSPINVFLGLLQSDSATISPDPNIYEVPPGAIVNANFSNVEELDTKSVKPPKGFEDYENVYWESKKDLEEELFSLPVEVIYSTVVKPKRKKCRPAISIMLHAESAGRTNNETTDATELDINNVNCFSGSGSAGMTSCAPKSDLAKSGINETSRQDNSIVVKITSQENSEDSSIDMKCDNCVTPSDKDSVETNLTIAPSSESNQTETEIQNCIDSCEFKSIEIKDGNCVVSCGNNSVDTDNDNGVASCEDNLIVTDIDNAVASCAENVKEGDNCESSGENNLNIAVNICESLSGGNSKIDDSVVSNGAVDDSINSDDISINSHVDKCMSVDEDGKNDTASSKVVVICAENLEKGENTVVLEISESVNGECSEKTTQENTAEINEIKIGDTSECECNDANFLECEKASVIEISEDGTWETKTLPPTELGQAKQEDQNHNAEDPEFLCVVDRSAETVKMAYGSQYYVNCPVASVKPMKHENTPSLDDDTARNIGAQIMKKYEEERQKLRENLPDVSLLDVDASMEDIQRERRRIIDNQTVRVKRIDSWIKNGQHPEEMPDVFLELDNVSSVENNIAEAPALPVPDFVVPVDNPGATVSSTETCTSTTAAKLPADGEVVYDSIIQNKHKTKSYWEQLMMAAATSDQPRLPYKRDLLSLGSDGEDGKPSSDVSEQEYYDARSQISLHSPAEPLDSLDQTYELVNSGPKIVETVAKKLMEPETIKLSKSVGEESVIEREIRLQREREEALAREREEALLRAAAAPSPPQVVVETSTPSPTTNSATPSPNAAETKIALELREMREREEELRRLRQRLSKEETDDGFNSIPNTDEGNFSEYGSEEKELSLDGNNSRMMSPEVPAGPGAFLHQRTQSMDSMSSGHSSGSGSGSGNADMIMARRRVTVKPLDEPEDDEIPSYMMRNQKETPIEREIRLSREREEELRREKRLPPLNSQPSPAAGKQEIRRINSRNSVLANDPRSVQHRLATSRIQQEIDEATEREKELREAGTIQTMSEETVDSKVTRFTDLAEFAIEERDRKLHKSISTSHIPQSVTEPDGPVAVPSITPSKSQNGVSAVTGRNSVGRTVSQTPSTPALSPRKFPSTLGQKGLMQRFLATRGKMGSLSSGFVTSPTSPSPIPVSVSPPVTTNKFAETPSLDERQGSQEVEEKENGDIQRTVFRRGGYVSAEEKIQVELQEMQKREEELRLQRARMFARSQPNLLCLGDDEEEESHTMDRDLENHTPLRSSLSNPNLLDSDIIPNGDSDSSLDKPSLRNIRKRSALIAQWENIIQKNIEH